MTNLEDLPSREPINLEKKLGCRPFCTCCSGGRPRGKQGHYSVTKAKSRSQSIKSRRSKPKSKDHR